MHIYSAIQKAANEFKAKHGALPDLCFLSQEDFATINADAYKLVEDEKAGLLSIVSFCIEPHKKMKQGEFAMIKQAYEKYNFSNSLNNQ